MIVDFSKIEEITIAHLNGGERFVSSKIFAEDCYETMFTRIPVDGSIGSHCHFDSTEFDYVISGEGTAVVDELTEFLKPGDIHICRKGSMHSILNTGDEELVLLTIIAN